MVVERFQIYIVKTTSNAFVSQEIESVQFYYVPKQNSPPGFYYYPPRQKGTAYSSQTAFFEDIIF